MPIYEYQCKECDETIEVLQKINEPLLTLHSDYKQNKCDGLLTKKISTTSFILKGSGWYKDGYS